MSESKVISSFVSVPGDSIFKPAPHEKATRRTVTCTNSENCGVFKRGQCVLVSPFGLSCPFGTTVRIDGPTRRSKNLRSWANAQLKTQPDVRCDCASGTLAQIGNFMYLPYSGFTESGSFFLPVNFFTAAWIAARCEHQPRSSWTGETVRSFQADVVPAFVRHMATEMPELLDEVCAISAHVRGLRMKVTNVGRRALVKTLNPNVGVVKSPYSDFRWVWDGEYLTGTSKPLLVEGLAGTSEVRVQPGDQTVVWVTDDAQVSKDTVFL